MRVIHLNEIVPDRLYQRGQFITFPWPAKMAMLDKHKIDLVVNLWSRPDPELHTKNGLIYIHWPIAGNQPPAPRDVIINCILGYMLIGKRALVHCEAGVNRSVWLVTELKARYQNIPRDQALREIQSSMRTKMREGLVRDLLNDHY